jgi:hypothetical protein
MFDTPLTEKEGYPDFEKLKDKEQVREMVTYRLTDFIEKLNKW